MINLKRLAINQILSNSEINKPILLPFTKEEMKELLFDKGIDNQNNIYYSFNGTMYSLRSKIDFSNVDFTSVLFAGKDLSNTYGIKFNPQTIYLKNLQGTILGENIEIIGNAEMNQKDLFEGVKIKNTDFNGCKNVVINPQTIFEKDLSDTKLKGVTFNGSFDYVRIWATDFTGSNGAKIDPKRIRHLDMSVCRDVILLDLPIGRGGHQAKNFSELRKKQDAYSQEVYELIKDQLPPPKVEQTVVEEPPKQKRKWFGN